MKLLCLAIAFALVGTSIPLPAQAAIKHYQLSIPRQSLDSALKEFAKQTGLQVARFTDTGATADVGPLDGKLTVEQALRALLAESGLTWRMVNERTIAVESARRADEGTPLSLQGTPSSGEEKKGFWSRFRLAQAEPASKSDTQPSSEKETSENSSESSQKRIELEEVVVTGTHIRGVQNSATPVTVFGREEIERTGVATTEDFIKTLPQNFTGGNSASVLGGLLGGENAHLNYGQATGINLRGLGNTSTLTLLNGRRIAPAGVGNVVDISMIPLGAIERMEVMTDGASAVYGSDAIGGVVNIITRRDFRGLEARARVGGVTSGSYGATQAGLMGGTGWDTGSVMLGYDYSKKDNLESSDRDFASLTPDPSDLLPNEEKHAVLLSVAQSVGERLELSLDSYYGKRDAHNLLTNPVLYDNDSAAKEYGVMADAQIALGAGWHADVAGSFSESKTFNFTEVGPGLGSQLFESRIRLRSLETTFDGAIAELPGGEMKFAIGGSFRREAYEARNRGNFDRDVNAAFAELFIPLVGEGNARPGIDRLELTAAGRYEHYTGETGSSTDPKFGVMWGPIEGLALRSTYGTSFRAPLLSEQGGRILYAVFPLPSPSGATPTLLLQGGNLDLGPEQARTWTFGIDIEPASMPNFSVNATYFNVRFEDRIAEAFTAIQIFSVYSNPANFAAYGSYLQINPPLSLVESLYASPYYGGSPFPASAVGAIINNQLNNIGSRDQDGIDLTLAYRKDVAGGNLDTRLLVTHLLHMDDRFTPAAPEASVLNTPYYPNDLRVRASVGWSKNSFSATAFVNHVGSYTDPREPATSIDSYTTFDLNLGYMLPRPFENLDLALSAQNLFDEEPPYLFHPLGLNFDPTNADALGRFVSFQVRARL